MNVTAGNQTVLRMAEGEFGWRRGLSMLALSLAAHACLLGLAAIIFIKPINSAVDASPTDGDPSDPSFVEIDPQPDPVVEPPILEVETIVPPPAEIYDLPTEPTPRDQAKPPVVAQNTPRPAVPRPGVPGLPPGPPTTMTGKSPVGWRTPKPVYPFQARRLHLQGSGGVRVSTNAIGRVIAAEMQPGIAPMLDAAAVSQALYTWSGPPNRTRVVAITFTLE